MVKVIFEFPNEEIKDAFITNLVNGAHNLQEAVEFETASFIRMDYDDVDEVVLVTEQ